MDTVDTLTAACIVLVLTNISFALLANHWRRAAKQTNDRTTMQLLLDTASALREGHGLGYDEGRRHAIGLMYKIAVRADHEGRNVLEALRTVGREQLDIPIVQVPESA